MRPNVLRPRWRTNRDGLRRFVSATRAAANVDSTLVLTDNPFYVNAQEARVGCELAPAADTRQID
jgi:hypothetical protein